MMVGLSSAQMCLRVAALLVMIIVELQDVATTTTTGPNEPKICPKLDLVFIVDSSGSINDAHPLNWLLNLNFVLKVSQTMNLETNGTRIGMVRFSNKGNVEFYMDEYHDIETFAARVMRTGYIGGTTNTADGLELARTLVFSPERGDRPDIPNVAVLVTDGQANERVNDTMPQAELTKQAGICIISVGVTDKINEEELINISSTGELLVVSDFFMLDSTVEQLRDLICNSQPPNPIQETTEAETPTTSSPSTPSTTTKRSDVIAVMGFTGATGERGATGPSGPLGPPGRDGSTGARGDTGAPGPQGATGLPGLQGLSGSDGSTGATGLMGLPGLPGPSGPEGKVGPVGWTGLPGPTGPTGATGARGLRGPPGATGSAILAVGHTGETGAPGRTGDTGASGLTGRTGYTGPAGPVGPQGSPGPAGERGQPGLPGLQGDTGTRGLPGERGPSGIPGITGETGSTGATGRDGRDGRTGFTGPQGPPGAQGQQGATGQPGLKGDAGERGPVGQPGLPGPLGSTGATGRPGLTGASGLTGVSGPTGPRGLPGLRGLDGQPGLVGATGSTGPDGQQGHTGSSGAMGRTGFTGLTGPRGFPGEAGATGPRGLPGHTGAEGKTGFTGAPGLAGPVGPVGASGQPGLPGLDGLMGLEGPKGERGATGERGPSGPIGLPGAEGPAGNPGPQGPRGLTGASGHTGATGRGSPGLTGAKGDRGDTGMAGPAGPPGATGAQGLPGSDGRPGPPGRDGNALATGLAEFGVQSAGVGGPSGMSLTGCDINECFYDNGGCEQRCVDTHDSYYCSCYYGYQPGPASNNTNPCPGMGSCWDAQVDVAFLLDSAICNESLSDPDPASCSSYWSAAQDFVISTVHKLNLGGNATRVAVIVFSQYPYTALDFEDNLNLEELSEEIKLTSRIQNSDSVKSNISSALHQLVKIRSRSSRVGSAFITVLVTHYSRILESNWLELDQWAVSLKKSGMKMMAVGVSMGGERERHGRSHERWLRRLDDDDDQQNHWIYYDIVDSKRKLSDVTGPVTSLICSTALNNDCSARNLDLLVLLDSSSSWQCDDVIREGVATFVSSVVRGLAIGQRRSHVILTTANKNRVDMIVNITNINRSSVVEVSDAVQSLNCSMETSQLDTVLADLRLRYLQLIPSHHHNDNDDSDNVDDDINPSRVLLLIIPSQSFWSNSDFQRIRAQLEQLQTAAGIRTLVVGFGKDEQDVGQLEKISSRPRVRDQNFWVVDERELLENVEERSILQSSVLTQLCRSEQNVLCKWDAYADTQQCFCRHGKCDVIPLGSKNCIDIDECLEGPEANGGCMHYCSNTVGSFKCSCRTGFRLLPNERDCDDTDECLTEPCSSDQYCMNSYGTYYCIIKAALGMNPNEQRSTDTRLAHSADVSISESAEASNQSNDVKPIGIIVLAILLAIVVVASVIAIWTLRRRYSSSAHVVSLAMTSAS